MRGNKPFMLIGFREKQCELKFHCPNSQHGGVRLIRLKDGWICPEGCGYTSPAIKSVLTHYTSDPSLNTQGSSK